MIAPENSLAVLQLPEREHQSYTDRVGNHTGIEQRGAGLIPGAGSGPLLFVHKFIGQHEEGERQGQYTAGSGPGVLTADQKVRRKKPAEEQDPGRQRVANELAKESMPTGTRLEKIGIGIGGHEPTATGLSVWAGAEAGTPLSAARQVLQMRGRAFRNDTLPLARQL